MNIYQLFGLLFFILMFPIPIAWIAIHKTIDLWRKLGKFSYFIFGLMWFIWALIIYQFKEYIISYRTDYFYFPYIGLVLLLVAFYIDLKRSKVFSLRYLIGLPEIENKSKLIKTGIYSKIRHPRYISYIFIALGLAFVTQLTSLFIMFPVFYILMYLLTLVEEQELIKRFGKRYIRYMESTSRFIPYF